MNVWHCSNRESPSGKDQLAAPRPPVSLRILIIDDNFEYADTLRYLVEHCGHKADVAIDGPSGVKLATTGNYDGIVCDIGLPGLNGYEVARKLRREPATVATRMVAVTAYGSAEAKRQSFAAGFDAHVVKPASVTEVLSQLGIQPPADIA